MRLLIVPLVNLFLLLRTLLGLPFRALAMKGRPEWIRFRLTGSPPYRRVARKRLLQRLQKKEEAPSTVRSFEELRLQVERLCQDPRIKGVVFELEELELSSAKRRALASILEQLRRAGKQCVGYAVTASNGEVQLLSQMDRVILAPAGRMDLVGFAAQGLSIARALEQVGVKAHFLRRGEFKTAPELFTHHTLSDIQRQTLERLIDERYQELVEWLARGRKVPTDRARKWVDEGPYSARRALAMGLCDALAAKADLEKVLELPAQVSVPAESAEAPTEARLGTFARYAAGALWPRVPWRSLRRKPLVAVVPIEGAIASGKGGASPVGPKVAGAEGIIRALRDATRNPRCKSIVLSITSPGGSAVASELILDEVKRAAAKKPLIAYVDKVAASGGYMAAVGAKEIWADPHALLGSIGVFAGKFDASVLLERLGVYTELVTRGAHSAIFSPTRGFSDSERAAMEAEVEETYQAFLEIVAQARKRTREEIHGRGEGRVFSGHAALNEGLIDTLGGFEEACRRSLELAQLPTSGYEVRLFQPPSAAFSLLRLLEQAAAPAVYALSWPPLLWLLPDHPTKDSLVEG